MFPIFDVSAWERIDTEQMGTKPKFWCLNQFEDKFLFKASRRHAGEDWSESVRPAMKDADDGRVARRL